MEAAAASRVVLVHDWLTGMRGGEKCLEVVARHWPDARLLTLLHQRGSVSPILESLAIQTSLLQWFLCSLQRGQATRISFFKKYSAMAPGRMKTR